MLAVVCVCLAHLQAHGQTPPPWHFVDSTIEAGLTQDGAPVEHGFVEGSGANLRGMTGGAAAGDFDRDGWPDLYVVRGDIGPNLLFRNRRDGTFEEIGAAAGVDSLDGAGSGPRFVDLDGDGWLDLIVDGFGARSVTVFRNRGDGTFDDVTNTAGIQHPHATFSITCTDYDADADVDVYTSHWGCPPEAAGHLWRNNGDGTFTDADLDANLVSFPGTSDWTFTPNFADVTNDGLPDLVIASDFSTSQIYHNTGQGGFSETPLGVASPDENGMGAALGDYDCDGDLDWFVTSVWDFDQIPESNWGVTGNRMYRNRGDGTFEDVTEAAGVREGDWGWGASFGDFDNDGWLDIFMVNGWQYLQFRTDPARLFVNDRDGSFTERGAELGVDDTGQGRGVVCFDYDRDGDLDLLIANNHGPLRLFRNETPGTANFVNVRLVGDAPNTQAIGARVYVRANGRVQMRELRAGSNYVSSNPVEAHFGLGSAVAIDDLTIVWPDGRHEVQTAPPVNEYLRYYQTATPVHVSEFSAVPTSAGIHLSWELAADAAAAFLQRGSSSSGPFEDIARFDPILVPRMSYLDAEAARSGAIWYRLMLESVDGTRRVGGLLLVDLGSAAFSDAELLWARADADGVRIRYRLTGSPTDVRVDIFDVRGRSVATPLSQRQAPGSWTLDWSGRSSSGQRLASGLYFVRLRTPALSRQLKLTLPPR
jgi:hypothetical protein